MPIVAGRPACPSYGNAGQGSLKHAGVAFLTAVDLGLTLPQTLTAGAGFTFPTSILCAGYNSFMMITDLSGGTNVDFRYVHLDPVTEASIAIRTFAAAVVPASAIVHTFGAFGQASGAAALAGDVFWMINISLLANTTNSSLTAVRLWMGTR